MGRPVEAAPTLEAVAEEAHQALVVHVGYDGQLSPEVLAGHRVPAVDVDTLDGDGRAIVKVASEDLGGATSSYHAPEVLHHGLDFIAREFLQNLLDASKQSLLS